MNYSWNKLTKAANKNASKNLSFIPTRDNIEEKVRKKLLPSSFFEENFQKRKVALFVSWVCAVISVSGAIFGISVFLDINSPTTYIIAAVSIVIIVAIEYGFRFFCDKYYDAVFLLNRYFNLHLIKFIFFFFLTTSITCGGIYLWNLENHAPDPALLAKKEELKELRELYHKKLKEHTDFTEKSTVKHGIDKGRIQFKLEKPVSKSKDIVDNMLTRINSLSKQISGKKVLDKDYQDKVLKDSIILAGVFLLFGFVYVFCMAYMSYFDNKHFVETYPKIYWNYVQRIKAGNEVSIDDIIREMSGKVNGSKPKNKSVNSQQNNSPKDKAVEFKKHHKNGVF